MKNYFNKISRNFAGVGLACISPVTGKCVNVPTLTAKIIVAVAGLLAVAFIAWFFFGKKKEDMGEMSPEEMANMDM